MREILFRAKSIQTGEWIEGIPIKTHLGLFISFEENPHYCSQYGYMEIDDILMVGEKTLCQFTGLCDKNGKKIWENDIVLVIYENRYYEKKELSTGRIVFIRGTWYIGGKVWNELYAIDEDAIFQVEIVGNSELHTAAYLNMWVCVN